ncbi:Nn.00g089500.m01.CDS01 [Neocucurbitaria sp. VM-36]
MAFKFSLGAAKASKAQSNSKAKEEEEAKAREEKNALDKVMADLMEEHGNEKSILGEPERDTAVEEDVFVPTGNKRHFTGRQRNLKSGPGTLETEPLDGYPRPSAPGRLAPQGQSRYSGAVPLGPTALEGPKQAENVFSTLVAKASNLPPTIDARQVEDLFAAFPALKVTKVEKIPPQGPSTKGRPSATMKVIFDKDANARDLDDAMNKLNDKKYLGKGYYLHLDRYLGGRTVETAQRSEAFGARWQAPEMPKGYAPPPDLGGGSRDGPREDTDQLIITANQPPDIATLRLVHQTIEGVILGGVEFEAALMNDPQIQDEERFAWLYDQKHPVNRYYRWRLHQIVCDTANGEIFARQGAWVGPTDPLADEFADQLGAFDSDDEYVSSEDEDEKEKPQFKPLPVGDNYPGRVDNGHGIMSPRSRTMFLWLLTSLPSGSILADDIAAISVFAVEHAAQGMDEVVHILICNIINPLQLTEANTRNRTNDAENKDDIRRPDLRQVTLNALRIISDVLLVTAKESGVSYKYRLAIGTQLVDRKVFEHLEQLPIQLEMGRMTEKSYRDEVNSILKIWQDEQMFEETTLNHLDEAFNARERQKEEQEHARRLAEKRKRKANVVRKSAAAKDTENEVEEAEMDIDEEDEAAVPLPESISTETPQAATPEMNAPAEEVMASIEPKVATPVALASGPTEALPGETAAARARRLRPKAEDMFASDEE